MMKLRIAFVGLILCMVMTLGLQAGRVSVDDARQVARNLYFERIQAFKALPLEMVKISGEFTVSLAGEPVYYVFNMGNDEGFVIISAEDQVQPVLAYSFQGSYRTDDHHPGFAAQMKLYEEQIAECRGKTMLRVADIEDQWNKYRNAHFTASKDVKGATIGPICKTTWDQGGYYNDSCPGNSVTGCVATMMAQVMKAFAWPPQGKGSYSYAHSYYGVQKANFGNTTYNWSAMPNVVSAPNAPVAQLMYHCGVSVDMNYSPGGSGASMHRAKDALYLYFHYSPFIRIAQKDAYSDIHWKILVRAQHMNGRPVMYSGPGHAFVCDGFQYHDHFHFNWGWGGSYDGYYYLTSLRPGNYNFSNGQDAILDCYPDTTTKFEVIGEGGMRSLMDGDEVQLVPNPVTDGKVQLTLMNDYTGPVVVTVTGLTGRQYDRFLINKETEWSVDELPLPHLKSGFYIMVIEMGNQVIIRRFLAGAR
ncbi:MAG: thiol protease/hemagglutinin PrtT [Bacteroidales bacterium]